MDKWYMQQLHNLGCYAPYVGRTLPVGHRSYMGPITLADDINPILFTARGVVVTSLQITFRTPPVTTTDGNETRWIRD